MNALIDALESLGYRPRAPVPARELADAAKRKAWVTEKDRKAFSFWQAGGGEVDILIDSPLDYREAAKSQVVVDVEGVSLPIASIEALIRLKEAAGREQDLSDVDALRRADADSGPDARA